MNVKQLYLAWVRTQFPSVYARALAQTFNPRGAGLGGLGDDLTADVLQPITVSSSILVPGTDSATASAIDAANADPSFSWGSFFNSLTSAISGIGQTVANTQAQQNLIAINTARARMVPPLPPLNQNGVPVTAAQFAGTISPTLQQMEANLAQAGFTPVLLIGGGLILALLLAGRKRG
jgi:hypothetical protein